MINLEKFSNGFFSKSNACFTVI